MNTNKLIPILLVLPFAVTALACPTRMGNSPDDTGTGGAETQTGGRGGAPQTGTGGAAGVAGGGGTVVAGTGGTAGATGTGGAVATGGVLGTGGVEATGGLTGTGGLAATGGVTGTGGSPVTCSPACSSSTQTCVGTTCLLNDGQSCSVASQCVTNTCIPFYVDQDGDGYGTGQAAGFCGTTPPVGYAAQTGDCCDTAANIAVARLIHPGAGFQTTSAGGVCNITWDYNCSGAIEPDQKTCGGCTAYPECDCADPQPYDTSKCGMAVGNTSCGPGSAGFCVGTSFGAGTLGCR
jgi:hypothetical protein